MFFGDKDSKNFAYLFVFVALLFSLSAFTIQNAHAGGPLTINDETSCESIPGAVWSTPPDTCTLTSNYTVSGGNDLTIASGVTLVINAGVTLTNDANIENNGIINNFGTIEQNNANLDNNGIINNYGTINNDPDGNSGNIFNQDSTINHICNAVYTGDPVIGNPPIFIPCPPPDDDQTVGGKMIPIETTSLLLASAQSTSWIIPVIFSVLGIGLFVVSRKS